MCELELVREINDEETTEKAVTWCKSEIEPKNKYLLKDKFWDFSSGAVVKNLPANAGDTGSSPGPGRSHMGTEQLSPCTTTTEPLL